MNGIHDMGGMHGFGPVVHNEVEVTFESDWERRTFGVLMVVACNGHFVFDESRSTIESMGHAEYLTTSYYGRWLAGLETLVCKRKILTEEEITSRKQKLLNEGITNG